MPASTFPQRSSSGPASEEARPESAVHVYAPASSTFSPADYAVGQVLSGRFRVEHVIGIGSMGVVLAARHLELDERVAIKFIRSEMQKLPGVLSRFAREAKAAVSIKSEHVAQVFDVGTAEGIGPYIVMEYLEGRDLGACLEEDGQLPIRRAVHYVMQACEALAVAHSSGITHRDIKPENLFLTRQGDLELIKLLDFGISKAALTGRVFGDELSADESSCLLGTPLYMSPEQIRSTSDVDHRSDIWSLGAVLYELISARSAFVADSVKLVWTRILETSPTPLTTLCPDVPPSLQAVIDRCLEKDPDKRFQNVAELAIALLPFAPSRARLYAQRASSILGNASDSIIPAPLVSAAPRGWSGTPRTTGADLLPTAIVSVPLPDMSAPPVTGQGGPSSVSRRRLRLAGPAVVAALTFLAVVLWLTSRRSEVPVVVQSPAAAQPSTSEPKALSEPNPLADHTRSRTVFIESEPVGAVVKVNGQALGVTPLSTLLPPGRRRLTLAKAGFRSRESILVVEAAAEGAPPVSTRLTLEKEESESQVEEKPRTRAARSRRRAPKPAPRRAPPRAAEPQPSQPAPTAEQATETSATVVEADGARLLEQRPRARLLGERPRAKLLE